MSDMYLPGMGPNPEEILTIKRRQKAKRTFICQQCHDERLRTVTWDPERQVFACYTCGTIDRRHTKEMRD